ncbi:zinc-dependent metalloprotease [Pseudactinotalea suaedae]|uniref:zinc-dependent metalloprotease n=1 Tax=Pseudactinotalea suaedae TaxID=1524924 RepID=UPI0012E2B01E|nr:zinc-dependent metalloprotease [Pseudactinotalea suaedae]
MADGAGAAAIDWDLARRRAAALSPAGPVVERAEASAVVASLRAAAARAPGYVGDVTGLHEAAELAEALPTYVIDRARWAEANLEMFADLLGDELPEVGPISARFAGEELGVLLSLLASRVLGQFDPFTASTGGGRLLVVAPNVLHVQRELRLDAADFHLWVCLHEQTHAVQFSAAPWLPGHLREHMSALATSMSDTAGAGRRLSSLLRSLPRVLEGAPIDATSGGPLMSAVLTADEQAQLERVLAVMALLEGHADVVMDEAGPSVVPTVAKIRRAFERRRDGTGVADMLMRRLLGMDAKLAQYRQGAAFVRGVTATVGHAGLNAVWSGPEQLPLATEITDPAAWVRRVHG